MPCMAAAPPQQRVPPQQCVQPQPQATPEPVKRLWKDAPLPAPYRGVGKGFKTHDFCGPTYYDPGYPNTCEGLNPRYYPFFHPRLWPNYKTPGLYCPGNNCGSSRSQHYWDSYDDWSRGSRYEDAQ